jgi:hypothetical protein
MTTESRKKLALCAFQFEAGFISGTVSLVLQTCGTVQYYFSLHCITRHVSLELAANRSAFAQSKWSSF